MNPCTKKPLLYEGCNFFSQRLILSCLSGVPVTIIKIRATEEEPGVKEFETSLLNLLDSISNGSKIDINKTGTVVRFLPGILEGGKITHDCHISRSIGYYLMPLIMLAPFCKIPVNASLTGITNTEVDPTVDMIKASICPLLKKFLVNSDAVDLKINKRGVAPKGGGSVWFTCPVIKTLKPFQWKKAGKIKKIRGTAYTSRTAPTVANRMMESTKKILTQFLSDVYFTVDNSKGLSPGYGINLCAMTTNETFLTVEHCCEAKEGQSTATPEDIGIEAAHRLLDEIHKGGCVDSLAQPLVFLLMVLNSKDVSQIVTGPLTPFSARFLRHMKDFFNVMFKIDEYTPETFEDKKLQTGGPKLLMTCVGIGYTNMNKAIL